MRFDELLNYIEKLLCYFCQDVEGEPQILPMQVETFTP